jgi:CMP-N-acetylneuraminic acid synthetase
MITAIVPARSGSKRLPGKNVKLLAGKPLVFHTIDSVLGHNEITRVIFTTDSEDYINIVKQEYGNQIDYEYRPPEYALDNAKVFDELRRLVSTGVIDTQWYLQCLPTCPLRDREDVGGLLAHWKENLRPLFSAVEYDFPTQFAFTLSRSGDGWVPLTNDSPMITGNTRSQDLPKTYRPNGAMYLQHVDNIDNKTLYMGADVYLMSREKSIDIDTELDFLICEQALAYRQ